MLITSSSSINCGSTRFFLGTEHWVGRAVIKNIIGMSIFWGEFLYFQLPEKILKNR